MSIQGITEEDIANFLAQTPGFFERHAELLSSIALTSPYSRRAVSLQERQTELLREKIKVHEHTVMELIRNAKDNGVLSDKLHRWTRSILLTRRPEDLPDVIVEALTHHFDIPYTAIRVWAVAAEHQGEPFTQGVSLDLKSFANSLTKPYCGTNEDFEAAGWLGPAGQNCGSLAMIPLRHSAHGPAVGLLVLGHPDPQHYQADLGTDFLTRIGEIASAGLTRLLPTLDQEA